MEVQILSPALRFAVGAPRWFGAPAKALIFLGEYLEEVASQGESVEVDRIQRHLELSVVSANPAASDVQDRLSRVQDFIDTNATRGVGPDGREFGQQISEIARGNGSSEGSPGSNPGDQPNDPTGPPENAGPKEDQGAPENAGPKNDPGPPEDAGRKEDPGPPETAGPKEDQGPPENAGPKNGLSGSGQGNGR